MLFWVLIKRASFLFSRRGIGTLLLCGMLRGLAFGQDGFVAIQPQQAAQYHIDFARNFFASLEAEKADRTNLYATLKALEDLKGKVSKSADNLLSALQTNDRVHVQYSRHWSYLYLRSAVG